MSLLLTLRKSHTSFHWWLRTSKCRLGKEAFTIFFGCYQGRSKIEKSERKTPQFLTKLGKFFEKHFVQFYLLFPETEGVSVPPQVPMICKIWTWGKGLGFLKILIYCIKKMKLLFKDLHIKCEQILKFLLIFTK